MKLVRVHKFIALGLCTIEFIPVDGIPGTTHRVVIDGVAQDMWLPAEQSANQKNAQFFVRVWGALRDGLPKYHYADRNEDPPARQDELAARDTGRGMVQHVQGECAPGLSRVS